MTLLSFKALHLQSILLPDRPTSVIIEETIRESRDLVTGCYQVQRVEKREHSSSKPELLEFAGEQQRNVGLVGRLKVAEQGEQLPSPVFLGAVWSGKGACEFKNGVESCRRFEADSAERSSKTCRRNVAVDGTVYDAGVKIGSLHEKPAPA